MTLAASAGVWRPASSAEPTWPTRALHLIVPFAPGGTSDLLARWLAPKLEQRLGQSVIVENRPGAAGNIALEAVARATPDGSTWLLGTSVLATNPVFMRMPVDPQRDVAPVILVGRSEMMVFGRKDLPAANAAELLALIRSRPGALSCAASGGGTRLGCELIQQQAGAKMVIVEYKGSAPVMYDLAAGHVDMAVDLGLAGQTLVGAGRIKSVARAGNPSNSSAVDVLPGFDIHGWLALFAPPATPPSMIARMNSEVQRILSEPATRERWRELDVEALGGTPEMLARKLREDSERYRRIAHGAGLLPP